MRNPGRFIWPRSTDAGIQRAQDADLLKTRGTRRSPPGPKGLRLNKSGTVLSVDWDVPPVQKSKIAGWRVYLDTEKQLVQAIKDPRCTHTEITIIAGSKHNVFVSSVNELDKESALAHAQL